MPHPSVIYIGEEGNADRLRAASAQTARVSVLNGSGVQPGYGSEIFTRGSGEGVSLVRDGQGAKGTV